MPDEKISAQSKSHIYEDDALPWPIGFEEQNSGNIYLSEEERKTIELKIMVYVRWVNSQLEKFQSDNEGLMKFVTNLPFRLDEVVEHNRGKFTFTFDKISNTKLQELDRLIDDYKKKK